MWRDAKVLLGFEIIKQMSGQRHERKRILLDYGCDGDATWPEIPIVSPR